MSEERPPTTAAQRPFSRRPAAWLLMAAVGAAAGLLSFWLGRSLLEPRSSLLPVYAGLPAFTLESSRGEPFSRADLEGRTWVVGFVFTRCQSICPLITEAMKGIAAGLAAEGAEDVGMLSLTVDPEFDRPEVLRAYASERGLDATAPGVPWVLLTGEVGAVRALVTDGYLVAMGDPEEQPGGWIDIAHGGRLALVDPRGDVRGYYQTDAAGIEELRRAVRTLAR